MPHLALNFARHPELTLKHVPLLFSVVSLVVRIDWQNALEIQHALGTKRSIIRVSKYEKFLHLWFLQKWAMGMPTSELILTAKAKMLYEKLHGSRIMGIYWGYILLVKKYRTVLFYIYDTFPMDTTFLLHYYCLHQNQN